MSHLKRTIFSIFIISAFIFTGLVSPSFASDKAQVTLMASSHKSGEKHECKGSSCEHRKDMTKEEREEMHENMEKEREEMKEQHKEMMHDDHDEDDEDEDDDEDDELV